MPAGAGLAKALAQCVEQASLGRPGEEIEGDHPQVGGRKRLGEIVNDASARNGVIVNDQRRPEVGRLTEEQPQLPQLGLARVGKKEIAISRGTCRRASRLFWRAPVGVFR